MKAKVITNDLSFLLGFRLGGIDGLILENEEEISYNFKKITKEKDLALIIFSKYCYEKIKDEVENYRVENATPLVVVLD
ncbi:MULTISPECIES: V-type ATP synthase subunit F [Anaerococcus]|uniref:V-type ATP synthase subunit F n=1 Tax=Anaerococcus TaxID=165779 RepID=UPI00242E3C0B|nr:MULTISPECIES: V-type ATP synthase subunit F [Anaerococcus]MDD7766108.1 V-type ATP synthase subunit F [Anaerococcus vaginalis]MDY6126946.1 V-type ATP synthase subunit F [Anaerococcus sp.]